METSPHPEVRLSLGHTHSHFHRRVLVSPHPVTSRLLQDGSSVFLTPIAPLASLPVPDLKISPLCRPCKVTEGPRGISS